MATEEGLRDGEVDHGVTEEFEPFVVSGSLVRMLVVPARVDEGLPEQAQVTNRKADLRGERVGGTHATVADRSRGEAR